MSKIKRALSAFLAIAIVFGMFSCLAPVAAPVASAEGAATGVTTTLKTATAANDGIVTLDNVSGIMSYSELAATYGSATGADGLTDGFLYVATEYYEYDESDNEVLTDYNVQPGEKLNVKVYVKSNMYVGEGYIISFYDNTVWDVKEVADNSSKDANGYTNNYSGGVVNSNHPSATSNGYTNTITCNTITNIGWIKNLCGFDEAYLAGTDLVQTNTLSNVNVGIAPYDFSSDEWIYSYYVHVKDTVEVGSTITVSSPDIIWHSFINPSTSKHDARKKAYVPIAHKTAADITDVSKCKTMASQMDSGALDNFIRALDHTFVVTESDAAGGSGGGSSSVKVTYESDVIKYDNTSTTITTDNIIPYADLVKDYGTATGADGLTDGFLYVATQYFEADGNPTDYYVQPGDKLDVKVYVKSNMYVGEGYIISFYDNTAWDVKEVADNSSKDANGYTNNYSGGVVNSNHPSATSNGYTNTITCNTIGNIGWIKNLCGFDEAYLAGTDLVQTNTLSDVNVGIAPYDFSSDEWIYSYYVHVKSTVAQGTDITVSSPDIIWHSFINPATNKHDARKKAYVPIAHKTAADITDVSKCKTMASQMDSGALDYFIRGLDHTFHIGNPPAAGTYTATFKVDGETYGDPVSAATGAEIAAPATNPSKDGYTFLGWAVEGTDDILTFPQTMGNENVTYVAVFAEVEKFTATFVVDGVTVSEEEYATGAAIVAPADPSKTGYTFAGWNPTVGTMGSEDITFTAQWTANTYNVSYYKETTDETAYQTLSATFDAAYNLPKAPTKTGYTFSKWVTLAGADMPAKHTVAGDVSYYASWTAGTFPATFKANGGTFGDTDTVVVNTVFNEQIVAPAAPTRVGYEFSGWSPAVGNMTAEGMTFTAQWTAAKIGVHFMDGETELALLTGDYDSDIAAMSPNPSKEGFTFDGWQYADGTKADFPIKLGAEPVYVYAIWIAKSYYIEFYDINNNWLAGGNQLCGDAIVAPTAPTVSGQTFKGWYDADDNPMPEIVPAIDNQVYYAKYDAAKFTATFYVDSTMAEVHDTYEAVYNSVIPAPEDPTKVGYTFKHWSLEGKTTKVTFNATSPKLTKDINYVAQWTLNSHDIVYYVDDVEVYRETLNYGDAITPYTYTPAEGESFSGWGNQVPATMPDNDVNVYGTTGTASYNVTFTIDGEEFQTISVAYGTAITVPTAPEKEGYTFSGWDVPDAMPAGDQTYDATYTANNYWVRFYLDDDKTNLYKEYELAYGTTIEYPADPEVDGQEFIEWDITPATVPANDVDIVAIFNPIEYFIEVYNDNGEVIDDWVAYWNDVINEEDLPEMTKEGFDFVGWFIDGVQVSFPYTVKSDAAFEPRFDVQSLKVIYFVDGSQYAFDAYEFGAAITLRDPLVKEGYTFSGWKDADGNDAVLPGTMPAEDITVYGTFTVNQYPVTFNAGEGTFAGGVKEITIDVDYGTIPVAPETPALAGYGFAGWTPALAPVDINGATYVAKYAAGMVNYTVETYTMDTEGNYGTPVDEILSGETDAPVAVTPEAKEGFTVDADASVLEGVVAADGSTVLKVYYIRNQYDLAITIDGETETNTYYYDEEVPAVEEPSKTGYTFEGWSEAIPAKMPAKDVTITAIFTINQYTITFVDTGDVAYDAITQDYATDIADIANPVKTGYTFTGWDVAIPETMPAEDLTITAQWTINQYTITFVTDGGTEIAPITQDYATAVTAPADPEKEGHKFTAWDVTVPETMPAEDITITAIWEVLYYDATFVVDGETTVKSTAYGTVPEITAPAKVGYTFNGWEAADGNFYAFDATLPTMVVGGATYTAKFTANTYDVNFDANSGAWDDGAILKVVPTVFDQVIIAPEANPEREAYIFAGWSDGQKTYAPDPETNKVTLEALTTVGITFTAVWTNDTSFCRVQSINRIAPEKLTSIALAAYEIKVMESPVKVQIAGGEDYTFTWTYDRLDETVADDLTAAGLVSIVAYNAADEVITDDSTDKVVAYEIWTVVTMLSEGDYKVRAKVGYTSEDWEKIETAKDYTVVFDAATGDGEGGDVEDKMILKVTPAENTVKRGNTSTVTVLADSSVTRIRLTMTKEDGSTLTVSYSPTATSYTAVTDNKDGTSTWELTMRFTYTGTELEQDQKWDVFYRVDGGSDWVDSKKSAEVKVTKYEQNNTDIGTYDAYSIISVTAPEGAVKGKYATVVILTTSDVSRVRLGNGKKTSTYLPTSNNATAVDNGNGTTTWTIQYRFPTAGEQTWTAQCRGNTWSTATEFTFTVAEA